MLRLQDFFLRRCTLEIRYDRALHLWDRAGALWLTFVDKFPDAVPTEATPINTQFFVGGRDLYGVQLERAFVITQQRDLSKARFMELTLPFMALVMKHLEIPHVSRIGLRSSFYKKVPDAASACATLTALPFISGLDCPFSVTDAELQRLEVTRRWRSKAFEISLRVVHEEETARVEAPPGTSEEVRALAKKMEESGSAHYAVLDVDYAASARVTRAQLSLEEWAGRAWDATRAGLERLLEGDRHGGTHAP